MPQILERTYDPTERMTGTPSNIRSREGMWRECESFARFLFRAPVGEVAAAVMRSRTARLYEDLLLYKEPAPTERRAGIGTRRIGHSPVVNCPAYGSASRP
jgi:hypothetical protein